MHIRPNGDLLPRAYPRRLRTGVAYPTECIAREQQQQPPSETGRKSRRPRALRPTHARVRRCKATTFSRGIVFLLAGTHTSRQRFTTTTTTTTTTSAKIKPHKLPRVVSPFFFFFAPSLRTAWLSTVATCLFGTDTVEIYITETNSRVWGGEGVRVTSSWPLTPLSFD